MLIVSYLLQNVKKHTQETRLKTVMTGQPTAYKLSAGIIFCEHLSEMYAEDVKRLQLFVTSLWREKRGHAFDEPFRVVEKPYNKTGRAVSTFLFLGEWRIKELWCPE